MAKNDEKIVPSPAATTDDELRALVKGGAEYEKRRPAGKPVTLSRIVAEFSEERRSPSMAGLPNWRASGTMPGIPEDTSTGTDPGLGPVAELGPEMTETSVGHLTTVQMPLVPAEAETLVERGPQDEPVTSERATPVIAASEEAIAEARAMPAVKAVKISPLDESTDVDPARESPSEGALKSGRVITIPDGNKAEWAEKIASQVRGGAPAKPLRKSTPKAPEAAAAPSQEAKSRRDEPTVIRSREDDTPDAPPVESRREEKRTELRIGLIAMVIAAVLVGVMIGRWVWTRDDGATHAVASAGSSAPTPSALVPTPVVPVTPLAPLPSGPTHMGPLLDPEPSATVKAHGPKHPPDHGHGVEPPSQPVPSASHAVSLPATAAPSAAPTAPSSPAPAVSGFRPF